MLQEKKDSLDNCKFILCGNKADLPGYERDISRSQAEEFAEQHNMTYFEVSALENTGIKEMFQQAAEEIHRKSNSV